MREHWELPAENCFIDSGPDWLLVLLDGCTREQKENTLLLPWRAWFMHNNISHGSGPTGVMESVHSLLCLKSSLQESNQQPEVTGKGKAQAGLVKKSLHKEAGGPRGSWVRPHSHRKRDRVPRSSFWEHRSGNIVPVPGTQVHFYPNNIKITLKQRTTYHVPRSIDLGTFVIVVRPRVGWIKVNMDASFVGATGCAGAGVVARE
jgi:hypothetical protein